MSGMTHPANLMQIANLNLGVLRLRMPSHVIRLFYRATWSVVAEAQRGIENSKSLFNFLFVRHFSEKVCVRSSRV
jgi:hypothetical protein